MGARGNRRAAARETMRYKRSDDERMGNIEFGYRLAADGCRLGPHLKEQGDPRMHVYEALPPLSTAKATGPVAVQSGAWNPLPGSFGETLSSLLPKGAKPNPLVK